ncbi:MAG: hypothetical protein U0527_09465 [Candidatus Eisenbacteria bacterium]
MTNAPYLLPQARQGYRLGNSQLIDAMVNDGLGAPSRTGTWLCRRAHRAEVQRLARGAGRVRARQSAQGVEGDRRGQVRRTWRSSRSSSCRRRGRSNLDRDRRDRAPTPRWKRWLGSSYAFEANGTRTAGNAPSARTTRGGAGDRFRCQGEGARWKADRTRDEQCASAGVEPEDIFYAPVIAVKKLRPRRAPRSSTTSIEANEALAAQSLVDGNELEWTSRCTNGGAIGARRSTRGGARVLVTLLHALQDRGARRARHPLFGRYGNAVALGVEML